MPQNWFEIELSSEFVPEHFPLELDTTPPVITWGTPTGTAAGQQFVVPYTVNEPGVISATIQDSQGQVFPLVVTPTVITGSLPPSIFNGIATVRALVRDEVLNETVRLLDVNIVGVPVEVEEREAGGGRPYTFGGRPAFRREVERIEAFVSSQRVEVQRVEASVSARALPRETVIFSSTASAIRRESVRFETEFPANLELAQALREDEELLLML